MKTVDFMDFEAVESNDSGESVGSRKRKERDVEDFEYRLNDDDYDTLAGNLSVAVERKRFKRLRRVQEQKSDEEDEQSEDGRDAIVNGLFHHIRSVDVPERMQLRVVPVTPVPEGSDELELEATWIYKQAFCCPTISIQDAHSNARAKEHAQKGPQTVEKIRNALDFMRNQNFEVPFISFYRKEYVQPELNINDLWKVYKYDSKWCQLQQRKQNLRSLFEKMRDYQLEEIMKKPDAPLSKDVRVIKDNDIERVKNVETNDELNDVHRHFMLYYSQDLPNMQQLSRKRVKKARQGRKLEKRRRQFTTAEENFEESILKDDNDEKDVEESDEIIKHAIITGPYAICQEVGLARMAKRFGLSPEHFAENLRDNYQRHEVVQESIEPMTVALDYKSDIFKTPEELTRAAQLVVAYQLAHEPLVRKCVRKIYMERAKLTVRPTKMGMKIIDEQHPICSMTYLTDEPVRDLVGDQFLNLSIAEKDKLIRMEFSDVIDGHTSVDYIEEMKQLYYRDEYSKHVQDWNALRIGSVEMAMTKFVIPDLKKELRANLITESLEYVMRTCCQKMYNWIRVPPYTCEFANEKDDDWDTSKGIRVMGLSYVPDHSQAAFACIIKPNGEFGDYLRLPNILKHKNSFRLDEKMMRAADMLALRNFVATQKPHVVALAGESREAIMLAEDVRDCVKILNDEEDFPEIRVEICDNDLAKIFANSNKGKNEFPEYPETLKEAISVARRLQDPLVEFSQLCTNFEDVLCLKYHQYQNQLPKDELLENLYLEFVNRVNEVGVDLNKSVEIPYWQNLVQFVCGLGPRKGQALIKLMKQSGQRLKNRTELVTSCHMGPKVFINCAGFIKIGTDSLRDSNEAYVEVLDGSRVHPEIYEWARKMAVDALADRFSLQCTLVDRFSGECTSKSSDLVDKDHRLSNGVAKNDDHRKASKNGHQIDYEFVQPAPPTPSYVPTPIIRKPSPRSFNGVARNDDHRGASKNGHQINHEFVQPALPMPSYVPTPIIRKPSPESSNGVARNDDHRGASRNGHQINHEFVQPALPIPLYVPTPIIRKPSAESSNGVARNDDHCRASSNGNHEGDNRQNSRNSASGTPSQKSPLDTPNTNTTPKGISPIGSLRILPCGMRARAGSDSIEFGAQTFRSNIQISTKN